MTREEDMAASSGGLHMEKEKSPAAEETTISAARQSKLADKLSSLRAEKKNESCLHVRPECWFQPFQVLATPVERSWSQLCV